MRQVPASIAEFGLIAGSSPTGITSGPNGNLWFTEPGTDKIGEISISGTVTEFALAAGSTPTGITIGPDGNLWFTEEGRDKIGSITTSGTITEYALVAGSAPTGITIGSNGNLWFTENGTNKLGEIVPSGTFAGVITEFALAAGSHPSGITSGPNGNLWFTENGANKVGEIVPSGLFAGVISEFSLSNGAGPTSITTGSDGNLWFSETSGGNIGRVTLGGSVTEFAIPGATSTPQGIVSGSEGDLFFTESGNNQIFQLTTNGIFTNYAIPTSNSGPNGITLGPDNHIWFTESTAAQISRLNLNPTAVNDSYTALENTALTTNAASGVLANDTDPEDDTLSVFGLVANPAHGSVALNANGSFTYTPNAGYFGPDSFTYQTSDGTDSSNTATVNLTVDATPVAAPDIYFALENTPLTMNAASGVLANDSQAQGHPLTAVLVSNASHGTVVLNANGSFTYTPAVNYFGPDTFTYKANDGFQDSNTVTVSLTVDATPVAVSDSYNALENMPLVVNAALGVLANDTQAQGHPLTAVLVSNASHGTVVLNANGSFTYTPAVNYFGPDTFTYKANDGFQDSNTVTVSLTVDATPVAVSDSYNALENMPLVVNAASGVLANDTQAQGHPSLLFYLWSVGFVAGMVLFLLYSVAAILMV